MVASATSLKGISMPLGERMRMDSRFESERGGAQVEQLRLGLDSELQLLLSGFEAVADVEDPGILAKPRLDLLGERRQLRDVASRQSHRSPTDITIKGCP